MCLREFLGQAWMKEDKKKLATNICLITERFNDVSKLVERLEQAIVGILQISIVENVENVYGSVLTTIHDVRLIQSYSI